MGRERGGEDVGAGDEGEELEGDAGVLQVDDEEVPVPADPPQGEQHQHGVLEGGEEQQQVGQGVPAALTGPDGDDAGAHDQREVPGGHVLGGGPPATTSADGLRPCHASYPRRILSRDLIIPPNAMIHAVTATHIQA